MLLHRSGATVGNNLPSRGLIRFEERDVAIVEAVVERSGQTRPHPPGEAAPLVAHYHRAVKWRGVRSTRPHYGHCVDWRAATSARHISGIAVSKRLETPRTDRIFTPSYAFTAVTRVRMPVCATGYLSSWQELILRRPSDSVSTPAAIRRKRATSPNAIAARSDLQRKAPSRLDSGAVMTLIVDVYFMPSPK